MITHGDCYERFVGMAETLSGWNGGTSPKVALNVYKDQSGVLYRRRQHGDANTFDSHRIFLSPRADDYST